MASEKRGNVKSGNTSSEYRKVLGINPPEKTGKEINNANLPGKRANVPKHSR